MCRVLTSSTTADAFVDRAEAALPNPCPRFSAQTYNKRGVGLCEVGVLWGDGVEWAVAIVPS